MFIETKCSTFQVKQENFLLKEEITKIKDDHKVILPLNVKRINGIVRMFETNLEIKKKELRKMKQELQIAMLAKRKMSQKIQELENANKETSIENEKAPLDFQTLDNENTEMYDNDLGHTEKEMCNIDSTNQKVPASLQELKNKENLGKTHEIQMIEKEIPSQDFMKNPDSNSISGKNSIPAGNKNNSKKGKFSCEICDKVFTWKYNLDIHVFTVHEEKKPFSCSLCNMSFMKKSNFDTHYQSKHAEKSNFYECKKCDIIFLNKEKLDMHIKAVHEEKNSSIINEVIKPYVCTMCDYSCVTRASMKLHFSTTHSEKFGTKKASNDSKENQFDSKTEKFMCRLCDKVFNWRKNLENHMKLVHEGKKPCFTIDDKPNDLIEIVHEENKPFECIQCNVAFKNGDALNKHNTAVHEGKFVAID